MKPLTIIKYSSAYGMLEKQEKELLRHKENLEQELARTKAALLHIDEAKKDIQNIGGKK